jgi:hypothetical protein
MLRKTPVMMVAVAAIMLVQFADRMSAMTPGPAKHAVLRVDAQRPSNQSHDFCKVRRISCRRCKSPSFRSHLTRGSGFAAFASGALHAPFILLDLMRS